MQNTLGHSLVDSLDSVLVGNLSGSLVTGNHGSLELLDGGLQSGLVSLVLLVSDLGRNDILLGGLDVGHLWHLLLLVNFIQLHIIAPFASKINPLF